MARDLSFGELVKLAVIAESCVGSFWGHERSVPTLRLRERRRPIAEALAARSDGSLWFARGAEEQWWWTDGRDTPVDVLGWGLEVMSGGWRTMPFHGLTTTSPFPAEMLATGVSAPLDLVWDICFAPAARWRLRVANGARVFHVDGPDDWENLVRAYPSDASGVFSGDAREYLLHERPPVAERRRRGARCSRSARRAARLASLPHPGLGRRRRRLGWRSSELGRLPPHRWHGD